MSTRSKLLTTLFIVIFVMCALTLSACSDDNVVNPPAPEHKIHSVSLKYNGATVEGVLTVDISLNEIQLDTTVQKDDQADGTVVYSSNNPNVATIDNTGRVTLIGEGETVISAKAGNQTHTIVLIIKDDFSAKTYTITVNGGTSSVSKAEAGEYVTLSAVIPEHKEFQQWSYSVRGLVTSGNVFKMPSEDIVITAQYTDKLYQLNVVGAASVSADGKAIQGETVGSILQGEELELDIVQYAVTYGTKLSIKALDSLDGKMFVGWDGGSLNNRIGDVGVSELNLDMPGDNYMIWANYSDISTKVLTSSKAGNDAGYWKPEFGSKLIENGVPVGEAEDPDLEGLSGYRLTFLPGQQSISDSPENITGSVFDTNIQGTSTMKAIFKNHGDYDVTLELYVSYYGNIVSSGNVTIPAHSTVTKCFIAGLGIKNPYWGIALREDINTGAGGAFNVDFVLGAAPTYPNGDPLLVSSGNADFVKVDPTTDKTFGWERDFGYNENYGLVSYAIYGAQFSENIPAARSVKITNMPEFDPENPYTTIYARVINNATSGDFLSQFDICISTTQDTRDVIVPCATIVYEKVGEVVVAKITILRTAEDGDYYLSVRKTTVEGINSYYPHNFSIVLAYNNVFGYEEEAE